MKKYAIATTGFKKPRYLYVALTALSKCIGIEKWDIIVYLDGGACDYSICSEAFPVEFIRRETNLGNKWNVPRSILDTFNAGYEKVIYMDEDNLLSSTTLEYLLSSTSNAEFISSFHKSGELETEELQSMSANLINKREDFECLYEFLKSGRDIGRINVLNNQPIPENFPFWDVPAFCWFRDEGHKTKWANKHYCLNFGVVGMNFRNTELEDSMFLGPPGRWMDRVLDHHARIKCRGLSPSDFVYE